MRAVRMRRRVRTEPRQFSVLPNPVRASRRGFPFVMVMQSGAAEFGGTRLVAPLVPAAELNAHHGRLAPLAKVDGKDYRVILSQMTPFPLSDLRAPGRECGAARDDILSGVDLLFFGV